MQRLAKLKHMAFMMLIVYGHTLKIIYFVFMISEVHNLAFKIVVILIKTFVHPYVYITMFCSLFCKIRKKNSGKIMLIILHVGTSLWEIGLSWENWLAYTTY